MRSKLEEQVADLLEELDVEYQYESEKISYMIEAQYIPDFKVGDVYVEAKGYFPADQRRNMKAVKKSTPGKGFTSITLPVIHIYLLITFSDVGTFISSELDLIELSDISFLTSLFCSKFPSIKNTSYLISYYK